MSNKEKKNLEDFSLPQLNVLLKHLSLGQDHLKFILSPKQLAELYTWCHLNEKQKQLISSDKIEMFGNMSLIINTILTSTFGAWMGLSGCIGCTLGSFKILALISFIAFFFSSLIGYMSLRMTKSQAHHAIHNQLIHQLQLRTLKIINEKMTKKIYATAFYLNTAVFILENKKLENHEEKNTVNLFDNATEAYQWFEKLTDVLNARLNEVQDPNSVEIYQKQINQMSFFIKKTLAKHIHFLENLALNKQQENKRLKIMPTLPFIKILTNPSSGSLLYHSTHESWIKNNFNQLLLGIIPTIWGGFASMFVFVGGIPNITKELNFLELFSKLTTPTARVIEITLAILVTCYFAFSFLYSSRKSWQRQQSLEKIEKEITTEESLLLKNNHKLSMLYKVKMHTQKLISTFTIVKKIDQNSSQEMTSKD